MDAVRQPALDRAMATRQPAMTDFTVRVADVTAGVTKAVSGIYAPVVVPDPRAGAALQQLPPPPPPLAPQGQGPAEGAGSTPPPPPPPPAPGQPPAPPPRPRVPPPPPIVSGFSFLVFQWAALLSQARPEGLKLPPVYFRLLPRAWLDA